jgi:phosphoglycolate phosphatase-like HAD superfamily hydrolase
MNQTKKRLDVDAVLWDFDGTLANSAAKNIAITKQILECVAPRLTDDNLPQCLQSEADYHVANHGADHWRDLYRNFFGMNDTEIEAAGPLWESYQMLDNTPVKLFKDVADTVTRLSHLPQGICSANASGHIRQVLDEFELSSSFQSIIGYEDLPQDQQKPAPDGGLRCLQEIFGDTKAKTIIFVGDHIADVIFARGLRERLHPSNTIISVTVTHSGANPETWPEQPDEVIESPKQLIDWVTI